MATTQTVIKPKPTSQPYRCPKGKLLKEIYFGTITKYVWDEEQKVYVDSDKQESIYFCYACDSECKLDQICVFTDTDNIASSSAHYDY